MAFLAKYFIGLELTSLTLLIIPLGSFLLGMAITYGFGFGLVKSNKKLTGKWIIIALIVAGLLTYGLRHMYYYMTYVDADNQINYQFKGDPISDYVYGDQEIPLTYKNLRDLRINSSNISSGKRGMSLSTRELVAGAEGDKNILHWLLYIIENIGLFLGAFVGMVFHTTRRQYCQSCRQYMTKKKLLKIVKKPNQVLEDIRLAIQSNNLNYFHGLVTKHSLDSTPVDTSYFETYLNHCRSCLEGNLKFTLYKVNQDGKYKLVNREDIKLPLKASMTSLLVSQTEE